ncbi:hypothetical protein [Mesorhizobium huakuii]|uniref:hypothetical protein n=1 Tax=Mesorhizobium huakuii TaxID=28104 RepID=UPI0024E06EE7|nr:hypothetical protein [Mesorhizobium huakuii]
MRFLLEQISGKRGKSLLAHIRFGIDGRDQPLNKLKIAVNVAFELGADDVDLSQHIGTRQLVGDPPVLLVGNDGADKKDDKSYRRRQVGGRKDGPSHAAEAESSDGQFDPDTFPEL